MLRNEGPSLPSHTPTPKFIWLHSTSKPHQWTPPWGALPCLKEIKCTWWRFGRAPQYYTTCTNYNKRTNFHYSLFWINDNCLQFISINIYILNLSKRFGNTHVFLSNIKQDRYWYTNIPRMTDKQMFLTNHYYIETNNILSRQMFWSLSNFRKEKGHGALFIFLIFLFVFTKVYFF